MNESKNEPMKEERKKKLKLGILMILVAIGIGLLGTLLEHIFPALNTSTTDAVCGIPMAILILYGGYCIYRYCTYVVCPAASGWCEKCDESLKGCAYKYVEINRFISPDGDRRRINVEFQATCPHCQAKNVFRKKFELKINENPNYVVDKYCEEIFE